MAILSSPQPANTMLSANEICAVEIILWDYIGCDWSHEITERQGNSE